MNVREQLAADTEAAIRSYDETFEWQGRLIPCVRRDEPTPMEVQEYGGMIEDVHYWLDAPKGPFAGGPFPVQGDAINSGAHQIKTVNGHKNPAAPALALGIGSFDS